MAENRLSLPSIEGLEDLFGSDQAEQTSPLSLPSIEGLEDLFEPDATVTHEQPQMPSIEGLEDLFDEAKPAHVESETARQFTERYALPSSDALIKGAAPVSQPAVTPPAVDGVAPTPDDVTKSAKYQQYKNTLREQLQTLPYGTPEHTKAKRRWDQLRESEYQEIESAMKGQEARDVEGVARRTYFGLKGAADTASFGATKLALNYAERKALGENIMPETLSEKLAAGFGAAAGNLATGKFLGSTKVGQVKNLLGRRMAIMSAQQIPQNVSSVIAGEKDFKTAAKDLAVNLGSSMIAVIPETVIARGWKNFIGQIATDIAVDASIGIAEGDLTNENKAEWLATQLPNIVMSVMFAAGDLTDVDFAKQQTQTKQDLADIASKIKAKVKSGSGETRMTEEEFESAFPGASERDVVVEDGKASKVTEEEPELYFDPEPEAEVRGNVVVRQDDDAELADIERQLSELFESGREAQDTGDAPVDLDVDPDDPYAPIRLGMSEKRVKEERDRLGLAPEEERDTHSFETARQEASVRRSADPESTNKLISEVNSGTRQLKDTDIAELMMEKERRMKIRDAALNDLYNAQQRNNESEIKEAKKRLDDADKGLEEVYDVAARGEGKAVTESARMLSALRMMSKEKYTLEGMEQALMTDNRGKAISDEQRAEIEDLSGRYEETSKKLEAEKEKEYQLELELEDRISTEEAQRAFDKITKKALQTPFKERKTAKRMLEIADRLESEYNEGMAEIRASASAGVNPMILVNMGKLGTAYALRGTVKFGEWADQMRLAFEGFEIEEHLKKVYSESRIAAARLSAGEKTDDIKEGKIDVKLIKKLFDDEAKAGVEKIEEATANVKELLKDTHPEATEAQIRDAFSDYGIVKKAKKDALARRRAKLRRDAQSKSSLERVRQGKAPLKTGLQRLPPDADSRQREKLVKSEMKRLGIEPVDKEKHLKSASEAVKSRYRNDIEELELAIEQNKQLVRNVSIVERDQEIKALKKRRDELRAQYDELFPKEPVIKTDQERLESARAATQNRIDAVREQILSRQRTEPARKPIKDDPILNRLKAEEKALNELLDKYMPKEDPYEFGKKQKSLERRLTNRITAISREISSGQRSVRTPSQVQTNARIDALKVELEARTAIRDAMFPKGERTYEQRHKSAVKAAERSLERINKEIADARKGIFKSVSGSSIWSKTISDLKSEQKQARAELKELKENSIDWTIRKSIENDYRQADKLKRRIADEDFEARRKKDVDISESPEALRAYQYHERVKEEFDMLRARAKREARTTGEKIKDMGVDILETQRSLLSSWDLSGLGRQGQMVALSNPVLWAKAMKPTIQSLNAQKSLVENKQLFNRKNARNGVYEIAGLALEKADSNGNFRHIDDREKIDIAGKFPGVNPSNRAYGTALNRLRADLFDKLLANSSNPKSRDPVFLKELGESVNIWTGRGNLSNLPKMAQSVSRVLWAPKFLKASFDILTGKPVLRTGGSAEVKKIMAKQYARAASSLTAIYGVAELMGSDIEWDPTSSDFGAIQLGQNFKVNPFGFLVPQLVFASRVISGTAKFGDKKYRLVEDPLVGSNRLPKAELGRVLGKYFRSKIHPGLGFAYSLRTGKTYTGDKMTFPRALKELTIPLPMREIPEIAEKESLEMALTLILLSELGFTVREDYSKNEKGRKRRRRR